MSKRINSAMFALMGSEDTIETIVPTEIGLIDFVKCLKGTELRWNGQNFKTRKMIDLVNTTIAHPKAAQFLDVRPPKFSLFNICTDRVRELVWDDDVKRLPLPEVIKEAILANPMKDILPIEEL